MIEGEVIISPDGKVLARTKDGTFTDGAKLLKALVGGLDAAGFDTGTGGDPVIEQHTHDIPTHEHVHVPKVKA